LNILIEVRIIFLYSNSVYFIYLWFIPHPLVTFDYSLEPWNVYLMYVCVCVCVCVHIYMHVFVSFQLGGRMICHPHRSARKCLLWPKLYYIPLNPIQYLWKAFVSQKLGLGYLCRLFGPCNFHAFLLEGDSLIWLLCV
jgi:hypothetical protein